MVNVQRCLELADLIEKLPHIIDETVNEPHFDMTTFYKHNEDYSCKTPACIAGWAVHKYSSLVKITMMTFNARKVLGLPVKIAYELFGVKDHYSINEKRTPQQAARALRRVAIGQTTGLWDDDYEETPHQTTYSTKEPTTNKELTSADT